MTSAGAILPLLRAQAFSTSGASASHSSGRSAGSTWTGRSAIGRRSVRRAPDTAEAQRDAGAVEGTAAGGIHATTARANQPLERRGQLGEVHAATAAGCTSASARRAGIGQHVRLAAAHAA